MRCVLVGLCVELCLLSVCEMWAVVFVYACVV